jgi:hypothetical protein
MNTAKRAREKLLSHADEIIDTFVKLALGKLYDFKGDSNCLEIAFKAVLPATRIEDDSIKVENAKTRTETVDGILKLMNNGEITPTQAEKAIVAVDKGTDVKEIETLIDELRGEHDD